MNILVVEDEEVLAKFSEKNWRSRGTSAVASDGDEALALAKSFKRTLLFSTCCFQKNGFEVLRSSSRMIC